ncbi:MAG: hypothetical protein M1818_007393 [Claussenomyces sp. TS43310]|nr:MAG: hypothetical protein M1818_007393 [Claussenomyces sp. TS43310]
MRLISHLTGAAVVFVTISAALPASPFQQVNGRRSLQTSPRGEATSSEHIPEPGVFIRRGESDDGEVPEPGVFIRRGESDDEVPEPGVFI